MSEACRRVLPHETSLPFPPRSTVNIVGDIITLDVPARTINLDISAEEFAARMAALPERAAAPERGYAQLYHNHVMQADEGADFDFLQAPR